MRLRLRSVGKPLRVGVFSAVVLVIFVGGTLAFVRLGGSVDWYSGSGQWAGAFGSIAAAGAALWIATTDRSRAAALRAEEQADRDADLAREAGLVRITAEVLNKPDAFRGYQCPGILVDNRRDSDIFDIEIDTFVVRGKSIEPELERHGSLHLYPSDDKWFIPREKLPLLRVVSDQKLSIFPKGQDEPAEYVAIRFTDRSGRRWQIDTSSQVTRVQGNVATPDA